MRIRPGLYREISEIKPPQPERAGSEIGWMRAWTVTASLSPGATRGRKPGLPRS